jgi:type IV secretory pathway VirB4 component
MQMIAEKLPFFAFEDEIMVYRDGSLGIGFKLKGADISTATNEEINSYTQKLEMLLVGLPENLKLQVFYRLTPYVESTFENHKALSEQCDEIYRPIREARIEFLRNKLKGGLFFLPEVYIFVRSAPVVFQKRKFFEKETVFQGFPEKEFLALRKKFEIVASQVESALKSAGLGPLVLTNDEWFQLGFKYFNFKRSDKLGTVQLRDGTESIVPSVSEQMALTNFAVSEHHLASDSYLFRVVSLGLLPEGETFASMIESLSELSFHFWISQNIKTLDQRKEIEGLELKRRIANSMASGSNNVSDIENESKLSHIEELLREVMAGSERVIQSDLNVIVWGESNEELEQKTEEVLRAFRSMNQAEGLVETFALEDAFFRAAPGVCEGFRHKKLKTSNCAHLMPVFASWKGNSRPVVLLTNRNGAPFSIDPFAQELPNWNGLIFGGSGVGKSFSIGQLMLQFCGQIPKPKIVWIDNGASSEKLIEVMNGEFIDLNLNSGIRLNMFDLDQGDTKPNSSKIKLILGCLELILKDEEKLGLPKREKALLEEAIFATYQKKEGTIPTLSDLKNILREHPVEAMNKFADILFSWTGDTAFGQMLDGISNVKLTKDLVSIEVKGLDNYKDLKDIFLLLLTSFIKNEAASDLSRPYMLIIDEAHRLFNGSQMGKEFAVDCFRVFRKYKAAIWCISQNYKDFLSDPELADSLMPNTSFVFVLRQRKIGWDHFKETFAFNDAQLEAAKSLEVVKGSFSEFLFIQDENMALVRLEPEPLSYWICTSDGDDKAKVKEARIKAPNVPLIEILKKLAKGETY